MRNEKVVETTQGPITVREITPGHLVTIKEKLTREMSKFKQESGKVKAAQKALDNCKKTDAAKRIELQAQLVEAHAGNATENNLKLIAELPRLIRDLSGDCLVSDNVKMDFNFTPFSELNELWNAFKEVNASFLALVPVDAIAEETVAALKSDLLPQKPSNAESAN